MLCAPTQLRLGHDKQVQTDAKTIETEITAFIANGAKQRIDSITPEDRLLEDGIIDSLSLLDLVDFHREDLRDRGGRVRYRRRHVRVGSVDRELRFGQAGLRCRLA